MTPFPGPFLLLGLPLLAAGLCYLVRRWTILAALLATLTTSALALLCLRLPLDRSALVLGQEVAFGRPVVLAGRTLVLDAAGQLWLGCTFALATVLFLLAWRLRQGRLFFSFGLVILSLYALTALLQSFSLATIVLAMSAAPCVFMIQGEHPGSTRAGQRYLLITLLAVPLLLAAAWLAEQAALHPETSMGGAAPLGALGFGLLLAVFPFGTWMPVLAAEAPPMATAFVYTAGQGMALFLGLTFVRGAPGTLANQTALDVLQFAGLVTAVSGGLMAAVQRDLGRVFGYAALSDVGCFLLAVSIGGNRGITLALLHAIHRSLPIALAAASLAILRNDQQAPGLGRGQADADRFDGLASTARRLPIATAGFLLGGLAVAGFPFTAGFPTHWAIVRAAAGDQLSSVILLLTASAAIAVGLLRALSSMLGTSATAPRQRQPVIASLMVLVLGAGVIALGLHPQLFLGPAQRAVEALALF